MQSKWALMIGMVGVLGAGLAWGELGNWLQDVPAAKAQALANGRPLLVMDGNSVSCAYCIAAENGVFSKTAWKDYARAKGIPQYYADGHVAASAVVDKALNTEYSIPLFPTILIFRVLDTADLTTKDLNDATNKVPVRNVELVGRFLYRNGKTINGIAVNSSSPANFIRILESFYSSTHPTWLQDWAGSTDTTPDAFVLADQTNVARSTLCTSNTITVAGINAAANISISGNAGQYKIGNGSWTAASGTVVSGSLVTVQQTSSPNYATTTSTTLTIGGVQDTFSVTTVAAPGADATPDAFTFTDQTSGARSTLCTSNTITVAGIDATAAISISGNAGQYKIGNGSWTAVSGTVVNGSEVTVQQTSSPNYATMTSTTLTIGGVADTFSVTTVASPVAGTLGNWLQDVPAAKTQALANGRPLLVMDGNSASCSYCIAAENGVFSKTAWKDYARAKGIPQYYADGHFAASAVVDKALNTEYSIPLFPTILIFRVLDTADLTTTDLNDATNKVPVRNVELVGRFLYRNGKTINGIAVNSSSPANFIQILESFYRTTHPTWLQDLGGAPTDTTPDAFAFTDQTDVARSALCTSNTITVTGIDAAAAVSISGNAGQYKIGSGSWTADPGTVVSGSLVTVRQTSSPNYAMTTSTTLTIGGVQGTFSVTTVAAPGDDADPADDVYTGATVLEPTAAAITVSTPRTLNGDDSADWFTFEAVTGEVYYFVAKNYTVPAGTDITFSIYDDVLDGKAAPVAFVSGMVALGQGFSYEATTDGTHYAAVRRPADAAVTGLAYTLTVKLIEGEPAAGEMTNPLWDTAEVGKWTMSYEKAAELRKPMLLLFAGVRWCPYCTAMDAEVISDPVFQAYVDDHELVLVLLDNARRNTADPAVPGSGPTLLREQSYLDAYGITTEVAEAKLAANLAFQQSLVLPGQTRIGYPTMLYVRAPDVKGAALPSVVGRVNYQALSTDLDLVLTQLGQLEALAADTGEERDNFASSTLEVLTPPASVDTPMTVTAQIGGLDTVDWRNFTPDDNTRWSFTVKAVSSDAVAAGAEVTVGVYDASGTAAATGTQLVASVVGDFAAGVTLGFSPPAFGGTVYRLCVQVAGQTEDVVDYTIEYSTAELSYEAQFTDATFDASQTDAAADLDVSLTEVSGNADTVELHYSTTDGSALAGRDYTAVADGDLSWTPFETAVAPIANKAIHIPLVADGDVWVGSRDFDVTIVAVSNCRVVGITTATVRIYCVPTFADAPVYGRTLSTGAQAELHLGVANGLGGTLGVTRLSGSLPPGITQTVNQDPYEVVLSGKPTSVGDYSFVLEARATVGGITTVGGQIAVNLAVKAVTEINPQGVGSFVGTLFDAGKPELPAVRGTVTLTASTAGRLLVKLTLLSKVYSYSIATWTEVDQDGTLHADLTDTRTGASLEFTVDPAGHGVGSFSASEGEFTLEMDRVPWDSRSNPASEYVGYYTVSLPVDLAAKASGAESKSASDYLPYGGGYLVFAVTAAGKTTYSGKLADGTRFSGSAVLVETSGSGHFTVFVPLYSKGGYLAGRLKIVPLADRLEEQASVSTCGPVLFFEWSYPGLSPRLGRTANAFTVDLVPCGAAYAKGATLESLGITAAELVTGEPPFDAAYGYTLNGLREYVYPVEAAFPLRLDLTVAGGHLAAPPATSPVRQADRSYVYGGSNDSGLKVTYSAATGVFSGSFKLYYDFQTSSWQHRTVTVTFEGVLTPVPGACCTADPLPLGHGFFLVSDNNEAAGYTFKRSYPVWLGEVFAK